MACSRATSAAVRWSGAEPADEHVAQAAPYLFLVGRSRPSASGVRGNSPRTFSLAAFHDAALGQAVAEPVGQPLAEAVDQVLGGPRLLADRGERLDEQRLVAGRGRRVGCTFAWCHVPSLRTSTDAVQGELEQQCAAQHRLRVRRSR